MCSMRRRVDRLRQWAAARKRDAIALHHAARDPRVPWHVKALAGLIAAYALSPVDLLPDFVPVLGYVDELILLPLAMACVIRLLEPSILAEHRTGAARLLERPTGKGGAVFVIVLWLVMLALLVWWLW